MLLVSTIVFAIACFVPSSCKSAEPVASSLNSESQSITTLSPELTVNELAELIHILVSRDLATREQGAEFDNRESVQIPEDPSNYMLEPRALEKRAPFQFYGARGKKAFNFMNKRFSYTPSRG